MDKTAAESYIYAKASGILGKSFIGDRASRLFEVKSLSELWSLIFGSTPPAIPEIMLAEEIEKQAFKKFISQYVYFIEKFDTPDSVLIDQLCIFEAENIKEVCSALSAGEQKCPELIDLGKYTRLNYKAWPDIKQITAGTPYAWYDHVATIHEQQKLEFKIDLQVIHNLWNSIQKTKGDVHDSLQKLYEREYSVKNIIWALRLKINYKMDNEKIIQNLLYVTDAPNAADPVAGPAIAILNKQLDNYAEWENWKYSELINPHVAGEVWSIDPTWMEGKNRIAINKMALLLFHQYPMTTSALIGWYKIKMFELSCIRTAVESLRMEINSQDAMKVVGVGE